MEQGMHDDRSDDILDDRLDYSFFEPKEDVEKYAPKLWQRALHGVLDGMTFFWLTTFIFLMVFPGYHETNLSNGFVLVFYFTMYSWWFIFEYIFNKTPSKFITRTRVVHEDGSKPTIKDIIIRTVARLIPFEFVSFFMGRSFGLHDMLSKTRVVKDNYVA
ncbi:MAG: RDD family protein [Chitinophagales bacterium]